jgi:hypothetical protein
MSGKKCLVKTCKNKGVARGLCWSCYAAARREIERGETSWSEIEAAGLSNPPNESRLRSELNKRRKSVC